MAKSNRICVIEGCSKRVFGREWCRVHYGRWRDYGNPLAGRTPNGQAAEFFQTTVLSYEGDECLFWPYARNAKGYGMMNSGGRQHIVGRLVCTEIHGDPPTPEHEAAHSCGKGHLACVTKRHLSWKTSKGNSADQIIHGTLARGEKTGTSKLTEPEVRQILALKGVMTTRSIANLFGISQQHASAIHCKAVWGWLD